jgi:hypothetical protein
MLVPFEPLKCTLVRSSIGLSAAEARFGGAAGGGKLALLSLFALCGALPGAHDACLAYPRLFAAPRRAVVNHYNQSIYLTRPPPLPLPPLNQHPTSLGHLSSVTVKLTGVNVPPLILNTRTSTSVPHQLTGESWASEHTYCAASSHKQQIS